MKPRGVILVLLHISKLNLLYQKTYVKKKKGTCYLQEPSAILIIYLHLTEKENAEKIFNQNRYSCLVQKAKK